MLEKNAAKPKVMQATIGLVTVEILVLLFWDLFFIFQFIGDPIYRSKLNAVNIFLFFLVIFWLFFAGRSYLLGKSWGRSLIVFFQILFIPICFIIAKYSSYPLLGWAGVLIAVGILVSIAMPSSLKYFS